MKKLIALTIICTIFLSACGGSNVTVTLPASFFESQTESEIIEAAKEQDMTDSKNSDGSYTYTMSKSAHEKMIKEYKSNIDDMIKDIVNGDTYSSYRDIKYNNDLAKISLYVDQEEYESVLLDGFAILGLYIGVGYYQIFNGTKSDDMKVTFEFINDDTKDIFNTVVYPDDLG